MDAAAIDTSEGAQNEDAIEATVPEVCRVCLLGNLMMRDLFVENEVVSLSTKAMNFASVKMLPGDGLPGQVCCDCADKLDSAYEFKLQVEQADNVLRQRYDSLNIKEELFFNEVEVHLEGERGDDEDAHTLDVDERYRETVDSLTAGEAEDRKPMLLKDHLALLQVQKLAEQECNSAEQKDTDEMEESNVAAILESADDHAEYLHENDVNDDEMPDCEVYRQSVKSEGIHEIEGIPIDEHNYIMQQGYTLTRPDVELEAQESVDSGAHESAEYLSLIDEEMNGKDEANPPETLESIKTEEDQEQQQQHDQHDQQNQQQQQPDNLEASPNETRRSKRKLTKRARATDEESYFENLNLSSRLKRSHEKSEKIYFLCFLCDKQFVSKEILKEHMHSHEEVRRAMSLKKTEKPEKRASPTKTTPAAAAAATTTTTTTPTPPSSSSAPTSSGKKPNKCPYCGKEYLYVISFNKHLKQHERNRDSSTLFEDSLPIDDESTDVANFEDTRITDATNSRVNPANEDDEIAETSPGRKKRRRSSRPEVVLHSCDKCDAKFPTKRGLLEHSVDHNAAASFRCSTCDRDFDELEKLRRHRAEHVVDGVLSEQDLEENVYDREFVETTEEATEIYGAEEEASEPRDSHPETTTNPENSEENDEENNDWHLEVTHEDYESSECKDETIRCAETEENWPESRDLKCPSCPMTFSQKKTLTCHLESHESGGHVCGTCGQKFTRKDQLQRHSDQHHGKSKSFKCTECGKIFGNELTLRNHLIATSHRTIVQGEAYDPNKRLKRVAAKAAQRIIDKIKTEDGLEDYGEEDEEQNQNEERAEETTNEGRAAKTCVRWARNDEKIHPTASSRKAQHRNRRRVDLECETCGRKCSSRQSLTKHMEQYHVKDEKPETTTTTRPEKSRKNVPIEAAERSAACGPQKASHEERTEDEEENDDENSDFESGLDWPMDNHECPTCKKKYSTKKSLLRHQLLHEEPNFECDICNVKFYRKDKLKSHYDKCSEKNPDQVRKCNICGDSFENNEMLREHRGKHVDEGILTEEDLREIEPDERRGDGKVVRKRRTDIVGLECTECNKRYTSRKGLLRHIQVHEGKKYLCDICPKKFYRREHLKIHVAKHNMIKPYKCSRCTKRFIKEDQLANHLSKHDRTFKKTKETDSSKRFLCEICSKSFTQSTTLIAHLRAHNGIKPYVCEVCARPFTTNAYLKMHMRTHTQERPYSCQYCSRAFARADTLANHLTSHTGEAKYHCKYCPKNFRRLKSLKEHVFIHTGQRPYSCPTCDRRFNNNGSRYAHSKRCKQNLLQNQTRPQQTITQHAIIQQQQQQQQQTTTAPQAIRIHQLSAEQASQMQVVKSQNIKTITIARPGDQVTAHQVMQHQEILMPLILPLTVTLTDVDEEVILPEGTKIFTTA